MTKTIKISAARLLEVTDDYNLSNLLYSESGDLILEYDALDGKYHNTLKLAKENVENSGISLYNFYSDNEGNYYYPIVVEPEYVE